MARIRTIKPEFFTSEDIVGLSPLARLLYIAVWCEADKEGRLAWKPMTFKLRYFPGDNCDIQAMCKEIVDAGLVKLYGEGYAVVPAFKAHQHINPRESDSQLPEPVAIVTRAARVKHASPRVNSEIDPQVGREGKGKEGDTRVASFESFYQAYPRKEAKKDAEAVFAKLNPNPELLARMLSAIDAKRNTSDWTKDGGKFVPLPATWLRAERWNDEAANDMRTLDIWAGAVN